MVVHTAVFRLGDDANPEDYHLNDIMIEDEAGQGLMRARRESEDGSSRRLWMYAPDEDVIGEFEP